MTKMLRVKRLDVSEMLDLRKESDILQDRFGNFNIRFRYDISDKGTYNHALILQEEEFPDNALLYQILKTLPSSNKSDEEKILSSIVFMDFSKVFQKNFTSSQTIDKTTLKEEELLHDNRAGVIAMFDFAQGIELSFDGINYKTFVPFDKSNSMSKKCIISFIDKSIKEELDKRLMLDMDLSNVPVTLSKYYAYRGLYLTSARRINSSDENQDSLTLNEETVIVVKDFVRNINQKVFTAKENNGLWEFYSQDNRELKLNCFDGEGLICPEYAKKINSQLRIQAHSFQIRLPFTKGVIHEVDFHNFFTEQLDYDGSELFVEDIFGVKRDLLKAKIILTESMFKCSKWIKEWADCPNDPMKYFFEKINLYEHALYVANTDYELRNSGRVPLNYQFISTLKLTLEELNSLVEGQLKKIKALPEDFDKLASRDRKGYLNDDYDEFDDSNKQEDNIRLKCLKVLANNDAFLKDSKVKTILSKIKQDYEKALCFGKFDVQGEVRFLSCDLLLLLLGIAQKTGAFKDEKIRDLKAQKIYPDRFYMPEVKLKMKSDKYYVFLRNPHLSRNEQCILRPYVKNDGVYEKYFSHLKGLVMVSCNCAVPNILGGADFDGDMVKVIFDHRIVDAVKRGAFEFDGVSYKRTLPVIDIPKNISPADKIPSTIPFRVVENTFASQVGLISNLAVKLAQKEYLATDSEQVANYSNKCAECTIVVGLEIDAAKNGVHPKKNIEILKKLADQKDDKEKNLFLDVKKTLDELSGIGWYSPKVVKSDTDFKFYLTKKDYEEKKRPLLVVPISANENACTPIELLPVRYLEYLESGLKLEFQPQSQIYFEFEKDRSWKKTLDSNKIETLRKLIQVFNTVRQLAKKVDNSKKWWANQNNASYLNTTLKIQYDDMCSTLPCGVQIYEAIEQMYSVFEDIFKDIEQVENSLKLLQKNKWYFTEKDRRTEKLRLIIGEESYVIPPAVNELLSTFRDNGFMLLFHVLREIKTNFKTSLNTKDFVDNLLSNDKFVEDNNKKMERFILSENPYWDEFYKEYCRVSSEKLSSSLRDKHLASICKKHIKDIFGDDMDLALKCCWSLHSEDKFGNFFWSIFDTNLILKNLPKKDGENYVK